MDPSDSTGSSQCQAGFYLVDEPGYYYIPVSGVYCIPGLRPALNHGSLQQVSLRDLLYSLSVSDPPTFHGSSHPNPLIASGFNFMPDSDSPTLHGSSQQQSIHNPNPAFRSGYNSVPASDRPAFRGSSQQQGISHLPNSNPPFGSGYNSVPGSDPPTFRGSSQQPLKPNPPLGSNRPTLHESSQQRGICHLPNANPLFGSGYNPILGSDGSSQQQVIPPRPGQAPGTSKPPIGEWIPSRTGKQYCMITISEGEDIVSKIKSVSLKCSNRIYVVSARGSVFNPILQPYSSHDSRGGIGKYNIQAMSISSYPTLTDESFKLSVTLVGPERQVIRGTIGRSFIAATPVQVIIGSCISYSEVPKIKEKEQQEDMEEEEEEEGEDYASYFSSEPPKSLYDT